MTKEKTMTYESFNEWLAELDSEAHRRGYGDRQHSQETGPDCWRCFYEDGYSPADALDADESGG